MSWIYLVFCPSVLVKPGKMRAFSAVEGRCSVASIRCNTSLENESSWMSHLTTLLVAYESLQCLQSAGFLGRIPATGNLKAVHEVHVAQGIVVMHRNAP